MTAPRTGWVRNLSVVALVLGAGSLTTSCGEDDQVPTVAAPHRAAPAITSTTTPTEVSDFPGGVYRTQIRSRDLTDAGIDNVTFVGIWTLTAESGQFRITCRPVEDPGRDCGTSPGGLVELGSLRGTAPTVYFVEDIAGLSKISGCLPGSATATGCGPEGGYRLDFRQRGDTMTFSNYLGHGGYRHNDDLPNMTLRPWLRIS